MVNVPLIEDKLAARLVLYKAEQGGYIDDTLLHKKDINDTHASGGRLMLEFTPTDKLTLDASGLFQKTTLDGQNSWYPALGKKDYSTNARTIAPTSDNLRLYNVTGKWDLNFATITGPRPITSGRCCGTPTTARRCRAAAPTPPRAATISPAARPRPARPRPVRRPS
jgi:hypothetical protein